MRILSLNVCKEYFIAIQEGMKTEEYRLVKPYWEKRMAKNYDEVHILCGYPRKNDHSRRLVFPYNGYEIREIIHAHFGVYPVNVFAIGLANNAMNSDQNSAA